MTMQKLVGTSMVPYLSEVLPEYDRRVDQSNDSQR